MKDNINATSKLTLKIGDVCIAEGLPPRETVLAMVHAANGLLQCGLNKTPAESMHFIRTVLTEYEKIFLK